MNAEVNRILESLSTSVSLLEGESVQITQNRSGARRPNVQKHAEQISLREAGFSRGTIVLLEAHGIRTLGDLALSTEKTLKRMGFAKKQQLGEIRDILDRHGLSLGMFRASKKRGHLAETDSRLLEFVPKSDKKFDLTPSAKDRETSGRVMNLYYGRDAVLDAKREAKRSGFDHPDASWLGPTLQEMKKPTDAEIEIGKEKCGDLFDLFHALRTGTPEDRIRARNMLVVLNTKLAGWYIKRSHRFLKRVIEHDNSLSEDDLMQEALIGLMNALEHYDFGIGCTFSTFAYHWLRQATTRAAANSGTVRIPVHQVDLLQKYFSAEAALATSLGRDPTPREIQAEMKMLAQEKNFISLLAAVAWYRSRGKETSVFSGRYKDEEEERDAYDVVSSDMLDSAYEPMVSDGWWFSSPDKSLQESEDRTKLWNFIHSGILLEAEQEILVRHFGLDREDPESIMEIGRSLGLSQERIWNLYKGSIEKLRSRDLWDDAFDEEWIKQFSKKNSGQLPIASSMDFEDEVEEDGKRRYSASVRKEKGRTSQFLLRAMESVDLNVRDREVLLRYTGVDGRPQETLREIAVSFGITWQAIWQNVQKIFARLDKIQFPKEETPEPEVEEEQVLEVEVLAPALGAQMFSREEIVRTVSNFFGISAEQIMERGRTKEVALPRQVCMYLFRTILGRSYPDIGRFFGRDHTTAMHGCSAVEERMKQQRSFARQMTLLAAQLKQSQSMDTIAEDSQ